MKMQATCLIPKLLVLHYFHNFSKFYWPHCLYFDYISHGCISISFKIHSEYKCSSRFPNFWTLTEFSAIDATTAVKAKLENKLPSIKKQTNIWFKTNSQCLSLLFWKVDTGAANVKWVKQHLQMRCGMCVPCWWWQDQYVKQKRFYIMQITAAQQILHMSKKWNKIGVS